MFGLILTLARGLRLWILAHALGIVTPYELTILCARIDSDLGYWVMPLAPGACHCDNQPVGASYFVCWD